MAAEHKQLYHESGMIDGSFGMVKVFETPQGLLLTLKDQKSGHTGDWQFDLDDESPLSSQLKEEARSKGFFKALVKKLSVQRGDTSVKLILKDITIEDAETKKLRKQREEEERLAREEAERLAREEAERLAKEEEERRIREEEARLEAERLAKEAAERDAAWLASLEPEERERVLNERNGLGTSIIDSVESRDVKDVFKDEVHPQLERPEIRPNARRPRAQVAKTFAQMEQEEQVREEEARKPKDQVDQEWDDPFDLLAEYKQSQKQKDASNAMSAQLFAVLKAKGEEVKAE